MKIRFFLLGIEAHSSFSRFDGELKQLFADFIEDNGEVSAFSGMKDATTEIAKAVSEAHVRTLVFRVESAAAQRKHRHGNQYNLLHSH